MDVPITGEHVKKSVFVSHSSKNFALADEIRALLEDRGVGCWIAPRDISGSKLYFEEIISGIRECSVTLLLLTDESNKSDAVAREIERSFGYQKPVLPLRLKAVEPSIKLEFIVKSCQFIDAFNTPIKKRVNEVIRIVRAIEQGDKPPLPVPENKSFLGRLERWLEHAFRHKRVAILIAFIIASTIGIKLLISIEDIGVKEDKNISLINQDSSTIGLVNLISAEPFGELESQVLRLSSVVYLNAKRSTFDDVILSVIALDENEAKIQIDLNSIIVRGAKTGAQKISFDVPWKSRKITFCMSAIHPHLNEKYTAKWAYEITRDNDDLSFSRIGDYKLVPGEARQCLA